MILQASPLEEEAKKEEFTREEVPAGESGSSSAALVPSPAAAPSTNFTAAEPLVAVAARPKAEAEAEIGEETATSCPSSEEGEETPTTCASLAEGEDAAASGPVPLSPPPSSPPPPLSPPPAPSVPPSVAPAAFRDCVATAAEVREAVAYFDGDADGEESDGTDDAASGLARRPCAARIVSSLRHYEGFWSPAQCTEIENWIDDTVWRGNNGEFRGERTLDVTPCRSKYFFGCGYTYGRGMRGREELLPLGAVDPIPFWMWHLLVRPLEERGVVPPGWIDSVVMNDYRSGSSIVAHVDPPRLFARPILTASFFHPARLVFGASFDPARTKPPAYTQHLPRGSALAIEGYAANRVTHGIRPEDLLGPRRVSLVLRHVIREPPEVPFLRTPPPVETEVTSTMVSMLQGLWRDAPGEGTNVYYVQNYAVTVYASLEQPTAPAQRLLLTGRGPVAVAGPAAADVAAAAAAAAARTLALMPVAGGLACGGAVLDRHSAFPSVLRWRGEGGSFLVGCGVEILPPARSIGLTWIRMQR